MRNRNGAHPRSQLIMLLGLLLVAGCSSGTQGAATAPTTAAVATVAAPTAAPATAATAQPNANAQSAHEPATAEPGNPKALRNDITVRKLLQTGGGFVRLKLDPASKTLYYLDAQSNVYKLSVADGSASKGELVYSQSQIGGDPNWGTSGMAFGQDGTLYVMGNLADKTKTRAIVRKGVADASGKRTWTTLVSTEPYEKSNTQFDHIFNGIVVSPDGKYLYMNSGSRTDHGEVEDAKGAFPDTREVPLTSAIFRVPTDTDDQVLPNDEATLKSKGYMFADGTRNAYDLAFAPNGDLFAGDNGPDMDLPDELNWLQEGHHYGFPWRFGNVDNPQRAADYDPSKDGRLNQDFFAVKSGLYKNDPSFPQAPAGVTFTDPVQNMGPDAAQVREIDGSQKDMGASGQPAYSLTPHRSPLGLVFDAAGAVGGDLKGDAFMLSWGAAGGNLTDVGRDLLDIKLTKAGDTYQAKITQLVVGFDSPVDGAILGNKIYVLDYSGKGAIWEVSLPS